MERLPFVFKNIVRRKYFEILRIFIEDEGLKLDLDNFIQDVIIDRKYKFSNSGIVGLIKSHSKWAEPDDLTNERIIRKYDGLQIDLLDEDYRKNLDNIADKLKRQLEEEVIIKENEMND